MHYGFGMIFVQNFHQGVQKLFLCNFFWSNKKVSYLIRAKEVKLDGNANSPAFYETKDILSLFIDFVRNRAIYGKRMKPIQGQLRKVVTL